MDLFLDTLGVDPFTNQGAYADNFADTVDRLLMAQFCALQFHNVVMGYDNISSIHLQMYKLFFTKQGLNKY